MSISRAALKGLHWTPNGEDEWISLNSRSDWYQQFPQIENDEARSLLCRILYLRSKQLRSAEPDRDDIAEVQTLAVKLFEGIAGWAFADALAIMRLGIEARWHPAIQCQIAAA